jgi:hypothetical protein
MQKPGRVGSIGVIALVLAKEEQCHALDCDGGLWISWLEAQPLEERRRALP